jgi:hypothetical protein
MSSTISGATVNFTCPKCGRRQQIQWDDLDDQAPELGYICSDGSRPLSIHTGICKNRTCKESLWLETEGRYMSTGG